MIHFKKEKHDAIHLAVLPAMASQRPKPSERIGIVDGCAYPVGKRLSSGSLIPYHGIVDPFLTTDVREGESFWFVMKPREVRSLHHVWEHPDFPDGE